MWNENLSWGAGPGCGARMRVLGCSRGPMRGPVSPYGVTGHAPFSDRETSCTAAGTRHRQIVSAVWRVPLCAGVGVHHLVSGPHAQAHAPAQVYPARRRVYPT